ncbi:MAG: hypothetical protein K9I94_02090 [Bacteroidales bacterium]|nr:hypothetical protein [Bacteroidales bacterium]
MIRNIVLLMIMMSIAIGCQDQEEKKKQESDLSKENKQLTEKLNQVQKRNERLETVIMDIKGNLDKITQKEAELQKIEPGADAGSKVQNLTGDINNLMMESKQEIESLNKQVRNAGYRASKFAGRIDKLEIKLDEKKMLIDSLNTVTKNLEGNISNMKDELSKMKKTIADLKKDNKTQSEEIDNKTTLLNTAYYAMGEEDALRDRNVVDKVGGFLGFLGRCEVLKSDFNKDAFNKIDIRDKKTFDIPSDDLKLATVHPEEAYEVKKENGDVQQLVISNPDLFWEASKYLVIIKD